MPSFVGEPQWAVFDATWYGHRYRAELGEIAEAGPQALAEHYATTGQRQGLSPNRFFDEQWYRREYPDVAAAVEAGGFASGFAHYLTDGYAHRSPHWLFSEQYYLTRYPDLTRATLERLGVVNGYDHYLRFGDREFRSGHLFFDPHLYYAETVAQSGEAREALDIPETGPFRSFLTSDAASPPRVSWYFDPQWYLARYPDIDAGNEAGHARGALFHYLTNPTPEVFAAPLEWFSESYYLELYPDIGHAVEKGELRSGYDHFVRYGAFERRKPHPEIDLNAYFFSGTVRADIENGVFRDAFAHWLARHHIRPLDADLARPDLSAYEDLALRKAETLIPLLVRHPLDFSIDAPPALSVVLFVRNRLPLTLATLSALRTTWPDPVEVIVIDAESRDDTTRLAHFARGLKILRLGRFTSRHEALRTALPHVSAPAVLWLGQGMRPEQGALRSALSRLVQEPSSREGRTGIVTGRVLRADGRLLEAGAIIGRDGSLTRYREGARMEEPEACFARRSVACGTAPALLIARDLLQQTGGWAAEIQNQSMQQADFCLRAAEQGWRTDYDPSFLVSQAVEGGNAPAVTAAETRLFRRRHAAFLEKLWPAVPALAARARSLPPRSSKRILFIEDRVPLRRLGSGFVRSNDIVRTMAALGHQVTVYPIYASVDPLPLIHADFPPCVEVLHDRGFDTFDRFLQERSGAYDCLWIGRTHNLGRMMPVLMAQAAALPLDAVVLDTEAVTAPRTFLRAALFDEPQNGTLEEALDDELASAWLCRMIVAVNALDTRILRSAGYQNVAELGHMCPVRPTPAAWAERRDILFLGAIHESGSPNHDSLVWFVEKVLPLLKDRLPEDVRFTVAGFLGAGVDLSALGREPRVDLVGPVRDPSLLYASHRIFVAPTRFAGGIPFKVHEAASYGLPVVASDLLCRQLGWRNGMEIVSGGDNDPVRFADQLVALHTSRELWDTVRTGALEILEHENSEKAYKVRLNSILRDVLAPRS